MYYLDDPALLDIKWVLREHTRNRLQDSTAASNRGTDQVLSGYLFSWYQRYARMTLTLVGFVNEWAAKDVIMGDIFQ